MSDDFLLPGEVAEAETPKNWKKLNYHPASEDFPMMEEDARQSLRDSVRENGFLVEHPIYLYEGKILDGRNRYEICRELKTEPTFAEYTGDSPEAFAFATNLNRRHLTLKQRVEIVQKKLPKIRAESEKRQKTSRIHGGGKFAPTVASDMPSVQSDANQNGEAEGKTRDQVAALLGVSPRTADAVIKVVENATPEVIEQMASGAVSISDAASVADKPKSTQRRAAKRVGKGKSKTLKAAAEDTVSKDVLGQVAPKKCKDIFGGESGGRQIQTDLVKTLKQAVERFKSVCTWNPFIRVAGEIVENLKSATNIIEGNIPYALCPACMGVGKCQKCLNAGFAPEYRHAEIAKELELEAK